MAELQLGRSFAIVKETVTFMKPAVSWILSLIITISLTFCTKATEELPSPTSDGLLRPEVDTTNFVVTVKDTFLHDKIAIVEGSTNYYTNALIYLPVNYSPTKKYPLVIFCHGKGQEGTDLNKLYKGGLPKVLKAGYRPAFDFIMIAPLRTTYSVDPKWLPAILEDARRRFPINDERIYLTGISAGGWSCYGSQSLMPTSVGKQFAAIVVCSGVVDNIQTHKLDQWKVTKTPVWAVVGGNDEVYLEQNRYMVSEINKRVPNLAALTVRPGFGHTGWDDVYKGKIKNGGLDMWRWLYQYKR